MGRWAYLDSDEERIPEGMTRVGYDADEGVYTYRDADGSHWQGLSGQSYGPMFRVGKSSYASPPLPPHTEESNDDWNDPDLAGQSNDKEFIKAWLNG